MQINEHTLNIIAKIHCMIPKIWLPEYSISDKKLQFTYESIKNRLANESTFLSVIEDENKIISYLWVDIHEDGFFIRSLWTDPHYRNQGHAIQLKKELEEWAKDKKIESILTSVNKKNHSMLKLNKKIGYIIYKETEHSFYMVKNIKI